MIVDQPLAPLAVLAFIGTALFIIVFLAMVIVARVRGRLPLAVLLSKILAGGVGLYVVVLLTVSAISKDYVLGRGAEKHFCEIDCHIANSVVKVETPTTVPLDFPSGTAPAPGTLYVVTLRTHFDEKTIGPDRGEGPLTPNPRKIIIRDEAGKQYEPQLAFSGSSLDQPLRPGEAYETRILFSLPAEAKNLRLFLCNDPWPNSLLIGHENSLLHGKAYFDLRG
jgi:hypothetical protein